MYRMYNGYVIPLCRLVKKLGSNPNNKTSDGKIIITRDKVFYKSSGKLPVIVATRIENTLF